jgi:hypothetical protein
MMLNASMRAVVLRPLNKEQVCLNSSLGGML